MTDTPLLAAPVGRRPSAGAYDRITDALRDHGSRVRDTGTRATAQCPAHEDRQASLSVRGIEGQALVYCHAGCDTRDVLGALGLELADLYDEKKGATYRYDDGRTVRRTPDKKFFQQGNTSGPAQLYHLSRLTAAGDGGVFLVEGEKDVHAIESAGGIATTAPMGAANFAKVDVSPLHGRAITVVVDRDGAGATWAADVRTALHKVAGRLRFVQADTGKDAADHIAAAPEGRELLDWQEYLWPDDQQVEPEAPERPPVLEFMTVRELRAKVAAAGPRRWLLRGLWPSGDYGVFAGDMKAQKSWTVTDAVVSVASGTPWLGTVQVDKTGPVVMFVGEGGEADALRRIDAVCVARGVDADDLPITICCRAPHLSDVVHLGLMAEQLARVRPVLTSLDPLYLSAGGAKGSDLYAMGQLLERPQHMCQAINSALLITTHQNRREGRGAARISGAGPAEWGRVLISATVKSRHLDKLTTETTVITELDVIGGSIPGGRLRVVRRIVADDPDDLDSPLRYHVECEEVDEADTGDDGEVKMPPARAKLLDALRAAKGAPETVRALVDRIAEKHGHGLARETCSKHLNALLDAGLADQLEQGKGTATQWFATEKALNADL